MAAKNLVISEGWTTVVWTATAPVLAGDIIVGADGVGRAAEDAATGEKVTVLVRGVLEVPKDGGAYTALQRLNWDGAAATSGAGTPMGLVMADAAAGDSYVRVSLNT